MQWLLEWLPNASFQGPFEGHLVLLLNAHRKSKGPLFTNEPRPPHDLFSRCSEHLNFIPYRISIWIGPEGTLSPSLLKGLLTSSLNSLYAVRREWYWWVTAIKSAMMNVFVYPGINWQYDKSVYDLYFCLWSSMGVFPEHRHWLAEGVAVINPVFWDVLRLQQGSQTLMLEYLSSENFLRSWCNDAATSRAYISRQFSFRGSICTSSFSFQCCWC